jgi:hypothetical protein
MQADIGPIEVANKAKLQKLASLLIIDTVRQSEGQGEVHHGTVINRSRDELLV